MNKDNKKFVVEKIFLKECFKHNLTLKEFAVLMYFDNEYDYEFDVKKIAKTVCMSEEDVLLTFGLLLDKKLLTMKSVKDEKNGKFIDKVSIDNFYNNIKNSEQKKKNSDSREAFFKSFQEGYPHALSPMDMEIINAWIDSGISEELILGSLKEANYNGVLSLRYMDKILFEWKKKGFNKMSDVDEHLRSRTKNDTTYYNMEVLDYNWLDD